MKRLVFCLRNQWPFRRSSYSVGIEWTKGFTFCLCRNAAPASERVYYEELIDQVHADEQAQAVKHLRDLIVNAIPSVESHL